MITYSQNGRIIVYLEQSHNNLSENKQFLHIRIVSECMNIDDVHLTKLAGILQPHADNMLVADDYDEMVSWLDRITVQYPEISVTYMTNPELEHTVYMSNGWEPDEGWRIPMS